MTECTDVGIGSDDEVCISGFVVEVGCYIDELVADVETCGEEDHGGEESDCVHSCIFFNCYYYCCFDIERMSVNHFSHRKGRVFSARSQVILPLFDGDVATGTRMRDRGEEVSQNLSPRSRKYLIIYRELQKP